MEEEGELPRGGPPPHREMLSMTKLGRPGVVALVASRGVEGCRLLVACGKQHLEGSLRARAVLRDKSQDGERDELRAASRFPAVGLFGAIWSSFR